MCLYVFPGHLCRLHRPVLPCFLRRLSVSGLRRTTGFPHDRLSRYFHPDIHDYRALQIRWWMGGKCAFYYWSNLSTHKGQYVAHIEPLISANRVPGSDHKSLYKCSLYEAGMFESASSVEQPAMAYMMRAFVTRLMLKDCLSLPSFSLPIRNFVRRWNDALQFSEHVFNSKRLFR